MTDLASDVDSLYDLIEDLANELREQNPDHDLLQFCGPVLRKENWSEEGLDTYLARFAPDDKMTIMHATINYFIALKGALQTTD